MLHELRKHCRRVRNSTTLTNNAQNGNATPRPSQILMMKCEVTTATTETATTAAINFREGGPNTTLVQHHQRQRTMMKSQSIDPVIEIGAEYNIHVIYHYSCLVVETEQDNLEHTTQCTTMSCDDDCKSFHLPIKCIEDSGSDFFYEIDNDGLAPAPILPITSTSPTMTVQPLHYLPGLVSFGDYENCNVM